MSTGVVKILSITLILCLTLPVYAEPVNPPDKESTAEKGNEKVKEKEKAEKKDDDDGVKPQSTLPQNINPSWASNLAIQLSTVLTALVSIYSFPTTLEKAKEAWADIKNSKELLEDYNQTIAEIEKFNLSRPELLRDLSRSIEDYNPHFNKFNDHVLSVHQELDAPNTKSKTQEIIKSLIDLNNDLEWKTNIEKAVEIYKARRSTDDFDEWINSKLKEPFFKNKTGIDWLRNYSSERKKYAALYWLEKGTTIEMDKWIGVNSVRQSIMDDYEKQWVATYKKLKIKETIAAKEFVKEYSTFIRMLNRDIQKPDKKFSELVLMKERDVGVFHGSDTNGPVPISAVQMKKYAESKCDQGFRTMTASAKEIQAKRSRFNQGIRLVSPFIAGTAAVGTGYLSISNLIKLINGEQIVSIPIPPPAVPVANAPTTKLSPN